MAIVPLSRKVIPVSLQVDFLASTLTDAQAAVSSNLPLYALKTIRVIDTNLHYYVQANGSLTQVSPTILDKIDTFKQYSTTEKALDEYWYDGKQIFEIVVVLPVGTVNGTTLISGVDKLVDVYFQTNTSTVYSSPMGLRINANPTSAINIDAAGIVRLMTTGNTSAAGHAILKYTKL